MHQMEPLIGAHSYNVKLLRSKPPKTSPFSKMCKTAVCIIQICSGITRGSVLNGELYAQILQKVLSIEEKLS